MIGYYLQHLIPETVKLLGSTKSKITKYENGKNVLYLQITSSKMFINMIQKSCVYLVNC